MTQHLIPLNSGHRIPQFGFGTYKISRDDTQRTVEYAIEQGYRHIDTAQMYGNEQEVGAALRASGISREEFFLTTKLDNGHHLPADARSTFAKSREVMGVDYVDLFLIHWPLPHLYGEGYIHTWETFIEFFDEGTARSIGVSNFEQEHLVRIIEATGKIPAVNQIELHPYFQNRALAEFCRENGIVIEAWAPLVRGVVTKEPTVISIAEKHRCTPAQAVLAWHLSKGHVIFPKSVTPSRIAENFSSLSIDLTVADVELIDSLDRGEAGRTGYHPTTMQRHPQGN